MTYSLVPFAFFSGETLQPSRLNRNLQNIKNDIADIAALRYFYSSVKFNLNGVASGIDDDLRSFKLKLPKAYEIIGIEISYYQGTGATLTVTSDATGFQTVTLASAGATTRAHTYSKQSAKVAASTGITITGAVSTGTIVACDITVHIRSDRFSYADPTLTFDPDIIGTGYPDLTTLKDNLNTHFTNIATDVAMLAANVDDVRAQSFLRRSVASSISVYDRDLIIPSSGRKLHSFDLYVVGPAANTIKAEILDEAASVLATATVTGSGSTATASSTGVTINDVQTYDDPGNTARDYKIRLTRTAGASALDLVYVVLYYV